MSAYYNEFDPYCAKWLKNLIGKNLIAPGDVDERDIRNVRPDDLNGYSQCHFFAGIGGWSIALRLARIPDDYHVWTGSCPCQPFSGAGKKKGGNDDRHLWPEWFRLIRESRPPVIFGEQVESAIRHGWLDLVSTDLEGEGYACGSAVLGAHSVGAPHIRQRVWFVADSDSERRIRERLLLWSEEVRRKSGNLLEATRCGEAGLVGGPSIKGLEGHRRHDELNDSERRKGSGRYGSETGFWDNLEWIYCRDGKSRPIESGIFPLVDGLSKGMVRGGDPIDPNACPEARIARLRGYGNAIVPQVAAEFIKIIMEYRP